MRSFNVLLLALWCLSPISAEELTAEQYIEKAKASYRKAIQIDGEGPVSQAARMALAQLYRDEENYAQARAIYSQISPLHENVYQRALLAIGDCFMEERRFAEARQAYREAWTKWENRPVAPKRYRLELNTA